VEIMMLQIIELVVPIFAVIAFGRIAVARRLLTPDGLAALNGFAYWLAMPALLFSSIAANRSPEVPGIAWIYLVCCLLVFAAAMLVGFLMLDRSLAKYAIFGLNASYGSVIFLGMPVVAAVFGPQGVTQIMPIIAFHSGVLLPLAAVLIELGSGRPGGLGVVLQRTGLSLLRNPIIMSIASGFLWRATGRPVPDPIHNLLATLGPAAAPLALFCMGASLPAVAIEVAHMREATLAAALKLTVLPLCVGWATWFFGMSGVPWHVAVVTAAMPTGANAFLLARRTTNFAAASASTVVMTTAISIISVTFLLTWLR
jgi:malonate transporter